MTGGCCRGDGKYVLDLHFSPGSDEATLWQVEGANGRSAVAFYLAAATRNPTVRTAPGTLWVPATTS